MVNIFKKTEYCCYNPIYLVCFHDGKTLFIFRRLKAPVIRSLESALAIGNVDFAVKCSTRLVDGVFAINSLRLGCCWINHYLTFWVNILECSLLYLFVCCILTIIAFAFSSSILIYYECAINGPLILDCLPCYHVFLSYSSAINLAK